MDANTFQTLLTSDGQRALALAESFVPSPSTFPACVDRVKKSYPANLAKAAVEIAMLRVKARSKFPLADRLYFTREALEQSSGYAIAAYRTGRFAKFECVADLCCGIGGDSMALAASGRTVLAVEQEPLLAEMTRANAAEAGVAERVEVNVDDVLRVPLGSVSAAFADPGRRSGEKRFLAMADYLPPPAAIRERFPDGFPLAFKLAPGIARAELRGWDAEAEFISVDGELKECVLWCGPLRSTNRRATTLRTTDGATHSLAVDTHANPRPPVEPGVFLFDPDSSVIRAELEHDLAERLDLFPIDDGIALFTGDSTAPTPFGDWYRVEQAAPFHLPRLRDYLRVHGVGRVTILKRASSLNANEVMRKLKLDGPEHRHVILTRSMGEPWALAAERIV